MEYSKEFVIDKYNLKHFDIQEQVYCIIYDSFIEGAYNDKYVYSLVNTISYLEEYMNISAIKSLNITQYMQYLDRLKRNIDEVSIYTKDEVNFEFPEHPSVILFSFLNTLTPMSLPTEDKQQYKDILAMLYPTLNIKRIKENKLTTKYDVLTEDSIGYITLSSETLPPLDISTTEREDMIGSYTSYYLSAKI